jgi:formamidopyrimidine-DNA glycosylase
MPELPETETIARGLDRAITGARIARVSVRRSDVLREVSPASLRRRLAGARVGRTTRRAKLVVTELDTGDRLVVQPRFTGALLLDAGSLPPEARAHVAITIAFDDGRALLYADVRRLGTVALMRDERWRAYESRLGHEPLDPGFTPILLSGLLRGSRQAVKKLLMDQRRLAGVGNIYATEALWRAGVDPSRAGRTITAEEAARLHGGLTSVLREAVEARGTSFRDYRDADGARGSFAAMLSAYGRAGQPCVRCGARLVGTHAIDGRATVFCPHCQR